MYVERSLKWGKRGLEDEENVTDSEERETNEERQRWFVNFCPRLSLLSIHILVMAIDIDWLGKELMVEIDMQSSVKANGGSISIVQ